MIIEVLFDEICNLYGDPQNAKYLTLTLPDSQIVRTSLDSEPYFANNSPDIILIGSMSDSMYCNVIEKLKRYKQRIIDLIEEGVVFLVIQRTCWDLSGFFRIDVLTSNPTLTKETVYL